MFKQAVDQAVSLERMGKFAVALEDFLVKVQLGLVDENPAKAVTALVKEQILDPALHAVKLASSKPSQNLYEAYVDTQIFGTGCAQAAAEAKCDPVDLAWLLGKKVEAPAEKFTASANLKKRRKKKC